MGNSYEKPAVRMLAYLGNTPSSTVPKFMVAVRVAPQIIGATQNYYGARVSSATAVLGRQHNTPRHRPRRHEVYVVGWPSDKPGKADNVESLQCPASSQSQVDKPSDAPHQSSGPWVQCSLFESGASHCPSNAPH